MSTESIPRTPSAHEGVFVLPHEEFVKPDTLDALGGVLGEMALAGDAQERKTASQQFYLESIEHDTEGPQLEGLYPWDMDKIMDDPRTVCVTLSNEGKKLSWPLITPITNYGEYLPGYFDRMEGRDNTYYVSLPSARLLQSSADQEAVGKALVDQMNSGSLLVYDEYDGQRKDERIKQYVANVSDADVEIDKFVDEKNNTPAAAIHYTAPLVLEHEGEQPATELHVSTMREAYKILQQRGEITDTQLLDPSNKETIDKLWNIYERQFTTLVENLPQRAIQTRREFDKMINDPEAYTLVRFEDTDPVAFSMFVTDISACDWLDTSYYKERFSDEEVIYFPGIASDPDKRGRMYSADIMHLFAQIRELKGDDFRLVWQCTNISAQYIPLIVARGIRSMNLTREVEVSEFGRYNYRGVRLAGA